MNIHSEWPLVRLEAHVDLLTGYPFKSAGFTDDSSAFPLVKGDNVQQACIDWERSKRWPKEQVQGLDRYWLRTGDVILAMDRPWIEAGLKYAWIKDKDPKALLVQRVARMRGTNGLSTDYLRYLIASPAFTDYIKPIVTGVSVPHISSAQIKGFQFKLPPYTIQHKIAAILSAYDDLIENNQWRIKILEEMTQRLYQEWFVHFRFPGHENVKMVDSELGLIPAGWAVKTIGNISEKIFSGGTPTTTQQSYWDGPFSWLSSGETRDKFIVSTDKSITEEGINNSSTRLAKRFDIVVASAGQGKTRGQTSLLMLDSYINQSVISIRVKEYCTAYILFNISSRYEELRNISDASSIRGSLTIQIFNNLPILLPDTQTLKQYNDIAISNILLIENIRKQNKNLHRTRTLLLPRLISGELDVENLDIAISEEMA